jgi:diaminohydroxyphosphoribosylaminopyrimidine deaminase/5-amino-6-(5-phosphoribosylamino)uracil reductase
MKVFLNGSMPPPDPAVVASWRALKLLARRIHHHAEPISGCSLIIGDAPEVRLGSLRPPGGEGWPVSLVLDDHAAQHGPPPAPNESRYVLDDLIMMRRVSNGALPPAAAAFIELYMPYCLAPLHARRMQRAFTISHFAQSLDGRIATYAGNARWIGCEENRIHAHRMRALCDGILIGAKTLRTDRPALTVRHAEGPDPARIVVGSTVDIDCLEQAGSSPILVIGDGEEPKGRRSSAQVKRVALPKKNGRIATGAILRELYRHDILSVYIEGGATTTSAFLAEGNIDVVQLHISPMIIGPGINSFSEPTILSVDDSVRFNAHIYRSIGDGMMFVGTVAS